MVNSDHLILNTDFFLFNQEKHDYPENEEKFKPNHQQK